jgi:hypothetical protein
VFEGVERAARGLKEDVLSDFRNESVRKERGLREAVKNVSRRKTEIKDQLAARKKKVDLAQQALIKAAMQRCDELRCALEAAAAEKVAALDEQEAELEEAAESLKGAREGAEQKLSSLVVEERPVEVVEACLQLMEEELAIDHISQTLAPIREANLHTTFTGLRALVGDVRQFGWSGALDVDVSKCTLSKQGEELFMGPDGSFEIILTTRDTQGQQLWAEGLDVKANVEPQASVDGKVAVEDRTDGTYSISFKSRRHGQGHSVAEDLSLNIKVCGLAIAGSPLHVPIFCSSAVTTGLRGEALLDLCQASGLGRPPWNPRGLRGRRW